jgi:hypothetical protein
MTTYFDPPSGWKYGFPKVYSPKPGESFTDTLRRNGYPEDLMDIAFENTRFWEEEDSVEGSARKVTEGNSERAEVLGEINKSSVRPRNEKAKRRASSKTSRFDDCPRKGKVSRASKDKLRGHNVKDK